MVKEKKQSQFSYDRRKQYLTIGTFVLLMLFLGYLTGEVATAPRYPVVDLGEHWSATSGARSITDVPLDEVRFGDLKKGESITYSIVLPGSEFPGACVQMRSSHAMMTAYLDGEEFYTDGGQYATEIMSPSYTHFIPLPDGYGNKTLEITMKANDDGAHTEQTEVLLGNVNDLYFKFLQQSRFTTVIGAFLIIMGFVLIFVFVYMWIYVRFMLRVFASAMLSLTLGTYMLTYYQVLQMFTENLYPVMLMQYMSMFSLPLFVALLLTIIRQGTVRYICGLITAGNLVFFLAGVSLQLGHEFPLNKLNVAVHLIIMVEGVLLNIILFSGAFRRRRTRGETIDDVMPASERILGEGLLLLLIATLVELVRYNFLATYAWKDSFIGSVSLVTLGALVFVISLVVHVFYYNIELASGEAVHRQMEGLAYNDPLTNLANRGRFDQMMEQIARTKEPYAVISMDVDHLKEVNDIFGHAEGDRLLSRYAAVLRESFESSPLIGRVGGDEFVVVLDGNDVDSTNAQLKHFEELLLLKNGEEDRYKLEASYGAAFSNEENGNVRSILALADERMYQMKRLRKGNNRAERQVRHVS